MSKDQTKVRGRGARPDVDPFLAELAELAHYTCPIWYADLELLFLM